MTQEKKLKEAKRLYKTANSDQRYVLESLFPELKENEDERIRKWIINEIKIKHHNLDENNVDFVDKAIAWLEKQKVLTTEELQQGKEDVLWCIKQAKKYAKDENEMGTCWFAEKWLEKQGEQKPDSNFVKTWKDMRFEVYQQASGNRHEPNYSDNTTKMFSLNDIDEIIEKLSEQKPFDYENVNIVQKDFEPKVEPKFKVGDWVVLTAGELSTTLQIVNVDINKKLYWFNDNSYLPIVDEGCLHYWTFSDAKDGDVLVDYNKEEVILIMLRRIGNTEWDGVIGYHCCYSCLRKAFCVQKGVEYWGNTNNHKLKPATKEQRDIFFQKMKEAGYEWNSENKELKKIREKNETN